MTDARADVFVIILIAVEAKAGSGSGSGPHLLLMRLPLGLLLLLAQFPSHFRLVFFHCLLRNYVKHTKTEVPTKGISGVSGVFWGFWVWGKNTQTVRVIPLDFRKGYWPHRAGKKKSAQDRMMMEGGKRSTASTKEMNCSVATHQVIPSISSPTPLFLIAFSHRRSCCSLNGP